MKFHISILCAVLLCKNCAPKFASNSCKTNRLKFTKLIDDVKHLILDELNVNDLLSMIKAYSSISPLAVSVFRTKYDDYGIYIWKATENDKPACKVDTHDKTIDIWNFTLSIYYNSLVV